MVEKAKERIVFSLDDKRLPVRGLISHGIRGAEGEGRCLLSGAVIFSFGMNDRHFGEEDVGLPGDLVRSNDESHVSPKESSCVVAACIDFVVGAAVAVPVRVVVSITARADITAVAQVAIGIDERCMLIVPISSIQCVLVHGIVAIIFWIAHERGTVDSVVSVVFVLKLDPGVEHGDRSATKI